LIDDRWKMMQFIVCVKFSWLVIGDMNDCVCKIVVIGNWWLMIIDWWLMNERWLMIDEWKMIDDWWMKDDWWLLIDDWWMKDDWLVKDDKIHCVCKIIVIDDRW
jgi:hypothetical protein